MKPPTSGDAVLVGYECRARLAGQVVAETSIREPKVDASGPSAIAQYLEWRRRHMSLGLVVSFQSVWLSRREAAALGFIEGSDA
ncbi:MAG: hypothetical protein QM784_00600 [Polyangiaceae bacterium]